jgi:arylsulfatase B
MRLSIFTLLVLVGLPALAQSPNVLLIIADDLGLDPTPGYLPGPTKAAMPHLESLMASGLTFDNVWANPLCSPTRATIISGKYGASTNVLNVQELSTLDLSETTVFEYLQQINSGYDASVIGKWHLGGEVSTLTDPNDQGIPHYSGLLSGGVQNYFNWMQTTDGVQAMNGNYITQVLTDSALAWINSRTAPWFCWLAYTAPHEPLHRPPLFMHNQGPLSTDPDSISAHPQPYFLAMIESLDFSIGRIMDSLPADVLSNTVIIFIGDNGTDGPVIQAPYDADHAKGSLYEGGVHVPLVITGPGVTRHNEREAALVNTTDLFATIVELTGHALPQYEQSKSLVPLFTQSGVAHRTCLRTEVSGQMSGGQAFRDARYKVIVNTNGNQEFYDLQTDPFETNDLLPGTLTSDEQQALDQLLAGCDITTGVEELPRPSLLLHPVPASTALFIDGVEGETYRISSADGGWTGSGLVRHGTVDVSGLAPGGYSLSIGTQHATFIKVE